MIRKEKAVMKKKTSWFSNLSKFISIISIINNFLLAIRKNIHKYFQIKVIVSLTINSVNTIIV